LPVIRPELSLESHRSWFAIIVRGLPLFARNVSTGVLQAISEAVTWCSYRELSGKPSRCPELDPSAILNIPDFSHSSESLEKWIERKRDCYSRATSWINETRSELLKAASIETLEVDDALSKSKLLIYEPLETVDDGAAEAASMGFYDLQDAPPWDTWFLYADRAVFCCVPEFAVRRAQDGIDANPVDCIHWADWSRLARLQK
jgi:hypothetical protein